MAHYVKTKHSPQFWYVDNNGEKTAVNHQSELAGFGWPLPLEHVTEKELSDIPEAGSKKPSKKKEADNE